MNTALALDAELRAAALDIHGVSIGDVGNKTTWFVDFVVVPPTPEDEATAEAIVAAFDADAPADPPDAFAALVARVEALEAA